MRGARLATCLWPGAPQLWYVGSLRGLAIALPFGLLLQFALLATFIWPELVSPSLCNGVWAVLAFGSAGAGLYNLIVPTPRHPVYHVADPPEVPFTRVYEEYLQGNWLETERLVTQMLRENPRDIEARLLRATLYRRTERFDEARDELKRLSAFDGAFRWAHEIQLEWARMAPQTEEAEEDSEDDAPELLRLEGAEVSAESAPQGEEKFASQREAA